MDGAVRGESSRRSRTPRKLRTSPCVVCGFYLTHRHHLLPVSDWGEIDHTVQLCGSCHDLCHLVTSSTGGSRAAKITFGKFLLRSGGLIPGPVKDRIDKIFRLLRRSEELAIQVSRDSMVVAEMLAAASEAKS